jgi:hypothetical protein
MTNPGITWMWLERIDADAAMHSNTSFRQMGQFD